mmetsp:Transcript_27350/g.43864  ORF Transcript_27350/g.43864 Transcript_27350/m.43864 type:complete len:258 (-) Transcript_27350:237-1010(-)
MSDYTTYLKARKSRPASSARRFCKLCKPHLSRVEFIPDPQPGGPAAAVQELSIAKLVGELQRVRELRSVITSQLVPSPGLVVRAQVLADAAMGGELAVNPRVVNANVDTGIHWQHVAEAACVGDIVAKSIVLVGDPDISVAARDIPSVGAMVALDGVLMDKLQPGLPTCHWHGQLAHMCGAGQVVDANWVLHGVAQCGMARKLTVRNKTASHAIIGGTEPGSKLRTQKLAQALLRHSEVVFLVAVEVQLHIASLRAA